MMARATTPQAAPGVLTASTPPHPNEKRPPLRVSALRRLRRPPTRSRIVRVRIGASWCPRRDSNPHARRQRLLRSRCLPIPPRRPATPDHREPGQLNTFDIGGRDRFRGPSLGRDGPASPGRDRRREPRAGPGESSRSSMRRQSVGVKWLRVVDALRCGRTAGARGVVPWARVCLGCARHSAVAGRCAVEGRTVYRCRADP